MATSGIKIDTATLALRRLTSTLTSDKLILELAGMARATMISRTLSGESLTGGKFEAYSSDRTYYAPIRKRTPGYPSPKGGRTKALRGGRRLKTMAFDRGYMGYKAKQGFGSTPQLSVSNLMLMDLQIHVISPARAAIFFGSRYHAAKAHGHHYGKRPFFGLTGSEETELVKRPIEFLRERGAIT